MARLPVPESARGRVRTSSFFLQESDVDRELWRRGWWEAYDGVPTPSADGDDAYWKGREEYFAQLAPRGAGRERTMTATAEAVLTTSSWSLRDLKEHPQNPRSKAESSVAIAQMRRSIERNGQLQPALVRKDGLVISGHVRKWANEGLGRETMPCVEIDCDDGKALALLIASNEHITPPDVFLEAEAVEELLHPKAPGAVAWTQDQVADALGRDRKWVARRAQLRNLSPAFRTAIQEEKVCKGWPIAWIEQLAILGRKNQDEVLARWKSRSWEWEEIENEKHLSAFLSEHLHVLSAAPFDPRDAELVPKAGPCVAPPGEPACPKTTLSRPGLFDDQVEGDVRTARCCDSKCWASKCAARVKADVAAAEEKHGKVLVVQPDGHATVETGRDAVTALGRNAVEHYQVREVKAASKGAEAAVFVDPDGSTREAWVQKVSTSSSTYARGTKASPAPAAEKTDAQRLKDSKEHVRRRRLGHIIDAVGEAVRDSKTPAPPLQVVLGFVAAYEVEPPRKSDYPDRFHADVKKAREFAAVAEDEAKLAAQLWARVRPAVAVSIARSGSYQLDDEHDLACWIAERIGLSPPGLAASAVHEVPAPRFWPEGADVGAAANLVPKSWRPAAAAKGKKATGAKAPTTAAAPTKSGSCRRCGCTDAAACVTDEGPCGWEDEEHTLCSGCVDPMGEELPPLNRESRDLAAYDRTGGGKPQRKRKGITRKPTIHEIPTGFAVKRAARKARKARKAKG